jgi:cephalosporin hydroxylase
MIVIDGDKVTRSNGNGAAPEEFGIGTPEAFRLLSDAWLRSGWDMKYVYSFTWLGRPMIQLPEDMIRLQEVIFEVRPDVIVETGVAHGGSLLFYASLCKLMGAGRVIGVDIEIREQNRRAIEAHPLARWIRLIEGDSASHATVARVRTLTGGARKAMVLLDSCHTKDHVRRELEAYAPMIGAGSYIVAMDGIMERLAGAPRSAADWAWNNPRRAAMEFVEAHTEFEICEPAFHFNEGAIRERVTYWPSAFIRRKAAKTGSAVIRVTRNEAVGRGPASRANGGYGRSSKRGAVRRRRK